MSTVKGKVRLQLVLYCLKFDLERELSRTKYAWKAHEVSQLAQIVRWGIDAGFLNNLSVTMKIRAVAVAVSPKGCIEETHTAACT